MKECGNQQGHCWHLHNVGKRSRKRSKTIPIICCYCSQERRIREANLSVKLNSAKAGLPMNKRDHRWLAKVRAQSKPVKNINSVIGVVIRRFERMFPNAKWSDND